MTPSGQWSSQHWGRWCRRQVFLLEGEGSLTHTIHIWHIFLHLVNLFSKFWWIYRTIHEFRFFLLSSSLCRIWTYQSKTLTVLQSRKLAEAIFTFFMWKLRGSAFCRNLSLCLLHFLWTTYKDIVYRHILRFIRCNCFTWAVVNTSWQWS